jgi:gluconolactonase
MICSSGISQTDLAGSPFETFNPSFAALLPWGARLERLATGLRWAEAPTYFPAGRYLIWTDVPNDRILRWDETDGSISEFRSPSGYTNGMTVDRKGRLVTCEHLARRVTRTEIDGTLTVLADRYQSKRLNSPNDIVVKTDGSIWFTDPSYGIDFDYEGVRQASELDGCHVYRIDPDSSEVTRVADDFVQPNGLAFSPDESRLYISDTGGTQGPGGPHHIRVFDVIGGETLSGGDVFAVCEPGYFDGFRVDEDGRLWASAGDGVQCFDTDGKLIGKIRVPETVTNLCFGGPLRNRLFITANTSLYSVYLLVRGVKTF